MGENHCVVWTPAQGLLAILSMGCDVIRDDDYLRQMLLDMEASPEWFFEGPYQSEGADPAERKRSYHLLLLLDAGLLTPMEGATVRMTSSGHDFLDQVREREAWGRVKEASRKMGGAGVGMMVRIAEAMVMQKLRDMGIQV